MVHRFVVELNEDINSIIMNAVEKDDMGRDPRISSMLYILYADKGCSWRKKKHLFEKAFNQALINPHHSIDLWDASSLRTHRAEINERNHHAPRSKLRL
jgi:hypothetical protein